MDFIKLIISSNFTQILIHFYINPRKQIIVVFRMALCGGRKEYVFLDHTASYIARNIALKIGEQAQSLQQLKLYPSQKHYSLLLYVKYELWSNQGGKLTLKNDTIVILLTMSSQLFQDLEYSEALEALEGLNGF